MTHKSLKLQFSLVYLAIDEAIPQLLIKVPNGLKKHIAVHVIHIAFTYFTPCSSSFLLSDDDDCNCYIKTVTHVSFPKVLHTLASCMATY